MLFTNDVENITTDVIERLAALRREFELDGDQLSEIYVPVGLLLDDVCNALALTDKERVWVLGEEGMCFVESVKTMPILPAQSMNGRHS